MALSAVYEVLDVVDWFGCWCFGFLQVWLRALDNGLAGEFVE